MFDFRSKYAIHREDNYITTGIHYVVYIKRWYSLEYSKLIRKEDTPWHYFVFGPDSANDHPEVEEYKKNWFSTIEEAERFAKLHAMLGEKAWIHKRRENPLGTVKKLGRLP